MTMPTALSDLLAVRPQWCGVQTAAQALGLRHHELLHAGPPLRDPRQPTAAMVSAIVMTCLHEGWATTAAEAEALLRDGALDLQPAQSRGCVTPLVAVVAAGTPLFEVADGQADSAAPGPGLRCWAPVSTVGGPDTRMGHRDPAILSRLQHRDQVLVPALRRALARLGPVPLWPLALAGLAAGDDLHGRTVGTTDAFAALLQSAGEAEVAASVAASPAYALTLWMAACARILRAAEGGDLPGFVTRAGGNGECFGIALAGRADLWVSCEATAPAGPTLDPRGVVGTVLPAAGDSAVIDMLGFGGQRLGVTAALAGDFAPFLRQGTEVLPAALLAAPQPLLPGAWPLGLDAARVVGLKMPPRVMLSMLAADGRGGQVGRGVYQPPLALFEGRPAPCLLKPDGP